jgi:hypothetical protein
MAGFVRYQALGRLGLSGDSVIYWLEWSIIV